MSSPSSTNAAKPTKPSPSHWSLVGRMVTLGWRYRGISLAVLGLNFLLVVLNLAGLSMAGLGIDSLREALQPGSSSPQWPFGWQPSSEWTAMTRTYVIAALVLVLAIVLAAAKFVSAVASAALSQRIVVQLRTDVYDKLQRLSFRFFDEHDSSSIINRVAGDVQSVRGFVDGVILKVLTVGMSVTVYLVYMVSVHPLLAWTCIMSTPLLCVGAVWFARTVRPLYRRSGELGDKMVSRLSENVQGIQVVKGFAREADEIHRFEAATSAMKEQKYDIFWKLSLYQPTMGFITQINQLIVIGYGGSLVIRGELPLGTGLFVFANLIHECANQVGQIINIANSIQSSLTGAERVFAVLDADIEIQSKPDAVRIARAQGALEFEDVSFAYRTTNRENNDQSSDLATEETEIRCVSVLRNVSFSVQPGETIGIVGETGAGKTTLLSLITRFYDATSGRVLVDGHDVRDMNLADLRRNIGIVFQESFLFSNTVAANIAFGQPEAEPDQIESAAKLAAAHEFVADLHEGYDSLIGEHGSNLSGGQRQRLAIARALLLDPPILLLDDATAAVDSETEHEIQQSIASATSGRTTILVSNRISALKRADRIYVLKDGTIVESGSPVELMQLDGEYAKLARLQIEEVAS